ncbi:MAG TPA: succinate dehydrogenase [Candidatus Binatia bacterium]|nr:succinate dehydrogenase [Candidatus Binatia bacterium]
MATATTRPVEGLTTRIAHLEARSPLERYGYLFMRLSGVALIVLAIGHMMIQHILNDVHSLTLEFVRQQWTSWGWRTYDLFLLVFAISHGFNGLRVILEDYIHGPGAVRAIRWILAIITIVTIVWSAVAIATFDASAMVN